MNSEFLRKPDGTPTYRPKLEATLKSVAVPAGILMLLSGSGLRAAYSNAVHEEHLTHVSLYSYLFGFLLVAGWTLLAKRNRGAAWWEKGFRGAMCWLVTASLLQLFLLWGNQKWDDSEAEWVEARFLTTEVSRIGNDAAAFRLVGAPKTRVKLNRLSKELLDQLRTTRDQRTVEVSLRKGAFGIPWVEDLATGNAGGKPL